MRMNIQIRKATKDDWQVIQKLNNEVFEDNAAYDTYLHLRYPFSKEGIDHYKKLVTSPDYCTFIAFVDGLAVGHISGGPRVITYRNVKIAEIIEFGVSPKYRSKGIGVKLFEELRAWCKRLGYQTMMVNSYFTNDKAIAFYKRQGLVPIDIDLEMKV